ncbi:uncharacterized protein [Amphiura filiformis]|uniref:uncharacterized protein n=1 Tax=Amphiura filiformis TaxID=82378 RepID=UPI003B21A275
MTHSDRVLSLLVIAAALPFIVYSVYKGDCGIRKLSPDEIFPIEAWLPQIDSFKVKSCGLPNVYFSAAAGPLPPVVDKFGRLEINFTAAYNLSSGNFIVNLVNRWPAYVEVDACDWARHKFGIKLCPLVKGDTYYMYAAGILNVPEIAKGPYKGNLTLVNKEEEVLLCLTFDYILI